MQSYIQFCVKEAKCMHNNLFVFVLGQIRAEKLPSGTLSGYHVCADNRFSHLRCDTFMITVKSRFLSRNRL